MSPRRRRGGGPRRETHKLDWFHRRARVSARTLPWPARNCQSSSPSSTHRGQPIMPTLSEPSPRRRRWTELPWPMSGGQNSFWTSRWRKVRRHNSDRGRTAAVYDRFAEGAFLRFPGEYFGASDRRGGCALGRRRPGRAFGNTFMPCSRFHLIARSMKLQLPSARSSKRSSPGSTIMLGQPISAAQ